MRKYIFTLAFIVCFLALSLIKDNGTTPQNRLSSLSTPPPRIEARHEASPPQRDSTEPGAPPHETHLTECWKKINRQTSLNEFKERNLSRWSHDVGSWFFEEDPHEGDIQESSQAGNFLLALGRGGLLQGRSITRNDDEALELLEKIYQEDPQNSAPLVFAAIIEKKRGNGAQVEHLLKMARSTTVFDSYLTRIAQSIFEEVYTPADLVQAYSVWASLPVPNYAEVQRLLENSSAVSYLGEQMMQKGLDKNTQLEDFEWVPVEYAFGRQIVKNEDPETETPDFRTLLAEKTRQAALQPEKIWSQLETECSVDGLGNYVSVLRDHLAQARQ